jgi:hypothetical protein
MVNPIVVYGVAVAVILGRALVALFGKRGLSKQLGMDLVSVR